jgi:hypothetical protein
METIKLIQILDQILDQLLLSTIAESNAPGAVLYALRILLSSAIAQGIVIAVWASFLLSTFSGLPRRKKSGASLPLGTGASTAASLSGILGEIETIIETIKPPGGIGAEGLGGWDTQGIGAGQTSSSSGPVCLSWEDRIEVPARLEANILDLDEALEAALEAGQKACSMVGELTKTVLSQSITVYEVEVRLSSSARAGLLNEARAYQDACSRPGDLRKLEKAVSTGGRVDTYLKERKLSAKKLIEDFSAEEVCALLALLTLAMLKASVKAGQADR